MNKLFDLRFVIGAFFSVIGALLVLYGFLSADANAHIINRWCGGAFVVFGAIMIMLSLGADAGDEMLE